ncbi:RimK/LysX family protein [Deltaproteobacteria bacterium TL4]
MKKKMILGLLLLLLAESPLVAQPKITVGWLEMVRLYPGNLKLRAKMDTGARSSSLNAPLFEKFQREGADWVRFEVRERNKNGKGKAVYLEKMIQSTIKIKRKGGGLEERPVVRMGICVGNVYKELDMNLLDRSNFNYQVLIGRGDLEKYFIIDPALTFTIKPKCQLPEASKSQ